MCDTAHVNGDDELERVRSALRRAMDRRGAKPKPLAKAAGLGETSVRDVLENPGRDIKVGTLRKIASALDTTIEEFLSDQVPITGRIGAGGTVVYEEASGDDTAPRPPGFGGPVEALEVVGDSMLPRYSSGDVVYIQRAHDGAKNEYLGHYCAIRLTTGETFVKQLARGSRPGYFTLRSLNAADIEDVEIEWATPILASISSTARQLLRY